jgi:hypothetical protein
MEIQMPQNETPPGEAGLANRSLLGGFDNREQTPNPEEKQAPSAAVAGAIIDLQREFVVEALRIASVLASHAADNAELGFDLVGEYELRAALAHFREGAKTYRELLQREAPQ